MTCYVLYHKNAHLNFSPKSLVKHTLATSILEWFPSSEWRSEVLHHSWHSAENKTPSREREKWVDMYHLDLSTQQPHQGAITTSLLEEKMEAQNIFLKKAKQKPTWKVAKSGFQWLIAWFQSPAGQHCVHSVCSRLPLLLRRGLFHSALLYV